MWASPPRPSEPKKIPDKTLELWNPPWLIHAQTTFRTKSRQSYFPSSKKPLQSHGISGRINLTLKSKEIL